MSDEERQEEELSGGEGAFASEERSESGNRPWSSFSELQEAITGVVDSALRGVAPLAGARHPRYDLVRLPDSYWILMDLPGVEKSDLEITTAGGELTVAGTRRKLELPEHGELRRSERPYGRFRRTLALASDVDANAVSAKLENGVLRITLPRRTADSVHRVDVI